MVIDKTQEAGKAWPAREGPVKEYELFPEYNKTLNNGMT